MNNFKETAITVSGIVAELVSNKVDITLEIKRNIGIPEIYVAHWENETYTNNISGKELKQRKIKKSFYVDGVNNSDNCITYLKSLEEVCQA